MIYKPNISLVIVSRDRPAALMRLISALRFQTYRNFEIIVVTNTSDKLVGQTKCIPFDTANISMARNLGIQAAGGDLIAFCDDDAVPEPTWLEKLATPFQDPDVGIAGGYVRGRNGIDYQWTALKVDQFGGDLPLMLDDAGTPQTFVAKDGRCPKVQGTNCMFRKSLLLELGGFDENFAFYLDETDICWRASCKGWATAVVPDAEVQHGFEESARRTANRAPKSLFEEGYSKAYFCKKHSKGDYSNTLNTFRKTQHERLIKLMVAGKLMPTDVGKLLRSLNKGLVGGLKAKVETQAKFSDNSPNAFEPQQEIEYSSEVFAGSILSCAALNKAAIAASQNLVTVTVFCWSFTQLFHRRYYDERGFWVQKGGLFGKSDRESGYFQLSTLIMRSIKEAGKLKNLRKIHKITIFRFNKGTTVVK